MTAPIPILIYSDNPNLATGLGRITRHLSVLLAGMPEFRVGTYGRGGVASRRLPWPQYTYPEGMEWGQAYLPDVWRDFSGGYEGAILTIMDAYRLHWFSQPKHIPDGRVKDFLKGGGFQRWGYFPVDHVAPNGGLSVIEKDAIQGYDRVLAYGMFGADVLAKTLGREVEWMPHGFNAETFHPMGREGLRYASNISSDTLMVGMVSTNQARKYWGLAAAIIQELKARGRKLCWWAHIDTLARYWDIQALLADYQIEDVSMITSGDEMSDQELAAYYSMCDVTMLPTGGEGYGYSIVESLACGTPCVTVNYAGGAELANPAHLVQPVMFRIEGQNNSVRPVTNVKDWADAIERAAAEKLSAEECRASVEHLSWVNLGGPWRKWLKGGIA